MYIEFGIDGVSYKINDRGIIKSVDNPTYIDPYPHKITGEKMVKMRGKELSVAELVLRWHGNPPKQARDKKQGEVARYIDGDVWNTHIKNLVWAKPKEEIEEPKDLPPKVKVFVAESRNRGMSKANILIQLKKQFGLEVEPYQIQSIISSVNKDDYKAAKALDIKPAMKKPDNLVPKESAEDVVPEEGFSDPEPQPGADEIVASQEKKAKELFDKQRAEYEKKLQDTHHFTLKRDAEKDGIEYTTKQEVIKKLLAIHFPPE